MDDDEAQEYLDHMASGLANADGLEVGFPICNVPSYQAELAARQVRSRRSAQVKTLLARYQIDPARLMLDAGFAPDPWQVALLRSADARVLILCARQVGKSTAVSMLALHTALTQPGSTTTIVAPVEEQANELVQSAQADANDIRQSAQIEADEMRAAADGEATEMRTLAQREADEMRQSAESEAEEISTTARREADELTSTTEREVQKKRSAVDHEIAEKRASERPTQPKPGTPTR